ncbi:hypothetical protein PR048_015297 [Dryococelus australis]|uniref:Uncharacterized protein n=1 Tax=Dryococelus australis TaxID=614101 RepID=A0ABQ9HGJ9_9NEOP|nr:hypothetical protein PR048_015297 [Dryococelus australis]
MTAASTSTCHVSHKGDARATHSLCTVPTINISRARHALNRGNYDQAEFCEEALCSHKVSPDKGERQYIHLPVTIASSPLLSKREFCEDALCSHKVSPDKGEHQYIHPPVTIASSQLLNKQAFCEQALCSQKVSPDKGERQYIHPPVTIASLPLLSKLETVFCLASVVARCYTVSAWRSAGRPDTWHEDCDVTSGGSAAGTQTAEQLTLLKVQVHWFGETVVQWSDNSTPTKANRVRLPVGLFLDIRKWESCRTMPLVGGFSRGSPVSSVPCITALLQTHLASPLFGSQELDVKADSQPPLWNFAILWKYSFVSCFFGTTEHRALPSTLSKHPGVCRMQRAASVESAVRASKECGRPG